MAREKGGFWVGFAAAVFYPATALMTRWRTEGAHHIPETGGVLLVMNHVSHLDPVYDAVLVHRSKRVPRFLAKHSLWKVPVLGSVLRGAQQIPVYRGSADAQQSLRAAHEALEAGKVVVIYPEGTITRDPDGWPMAARTGVARLALEHDVPVLPAARWGTRDVYDHYRKKFRPLPRKTVVTAVGEPVDLDALRAQPQNLALLRETTDLIMGRVKDLLADIRHEQAPDGFYGKKV
ncbi:lysophospholipid acyltransferase family protein [Saccharothrix coeruleofusca]|uniref:1-acyl-sn-glycerol-3-phosphate acyltransferase n=1 Tax=Saccharothrix coeruleofusca TaxID=33919 RepID=A0A918AIN9_9PSEU|nr:lysophospholipid acyltransferase family protein [Saccharothrix coeruleofusca]MBP2338607.1 1-acyl-sn-glycerol-3-phosphate acyltransferase [Saccharothrix coeruleofusca]GGP47238.1 1-acyl-sn-glycerol-3-phosphate acyltransferase [Saccharothrix coeruleofusca]